MDTGINQHGYRWKIVDHSARRKGFTAVVWTADQGDTPKSIAARSGFATHGDALAWVNDYEGRREQRGSTADARVVVAFGVVGLAVISMAAVLRVWIVGRTIQRAAQSGAGVRYTTRCSAGRQGRARVLGRDSLGAVGGRPVGDHGNAEFWSTLCSVAAIRGTGYQT